MNQEHEKKPPAGANWIWVMGGCYLLYLAADMLMRVHDGTTEMVGVSIVGAVVFIVCGIAIGYPDWEFPANQVISTRVPVDEITTWCGF